MGIRESYENVLNQLYDLGKISEQEARSLAEYNNAANAEKKIGERAEILLLMAEVTDDIYDFVGDRHQDEIEDFIQDVKNIKYIDWENKVVDKSGLENELEEVAGSDDNVTERGVDYLERMDELLEEGVKTWNRSAEFIGNALEETGEESQDLGHDDYPDEVPGELEGRSDQEYPELDNEEDLEIDLGSDDTSKDRETEDLSEDDNDILEQGTEEKDNITIYSPEGLVERIGSFILREKDIRGPYTEGDEE